MNYVTLIALTLLLFSRNTLSASEIQNISDACRTNPMFGYFYRQNRYSTQDHQEDMILASLGLRYSETLLDRTHIRPLEPKTRRAAVRFIEENCSPYTTNMEFGSNDLKNLGEYIDQRQVHELEVCRAQSQQMETIEEFDCEVGKIIRKSPVTVKGYTEKFQNIIEKFKAQNDTIVFRSALIDGQEKQREINKKILPAAVMSKLLATLAMGATSRYMKTESDESLRQWLKSQPFSSVSPEELFEQSLKLQNGDIYKAILSIENVLSEYWLAPNRQHLRQTSALKSITNHCPGTRQIDAATPAKEGTSEDVFGSWYHLFGTMLLGCVEGRLFPLLLVQQSLWVDVCSILKVRKKVVMDWHIT